MINNYDDFIEREIFEFTKNDKSVPSFVDRAINNAINRVKPSNRIFYKIKKIIIFILSLGVMATSVVFAKDIVRFFKAIFTNSTPGINSAIENGEVHNIDMDFVYSNNVGIKVNSIVEDDNVIDIAFVFDVPDEEGITNIVLSDFEVFDGDKLIADYLYSLNDSDYIKNKEDISKTIQMINDFKVIDGKYYKSILLSIEEKINIQNLKLNISQVQLYKNREINNINGNWSFDINLNKNENNLNEVLSNDESNEYTVNYDKNIIKDINYEVNDTNFVINIEFLEEFNLYLISEFESITIKDELENKIDVTSASFMENKRNISIEISYGKHNLPEYLNLIIKYDNNKDTTIDFNK